MLLNAVFEAFVDRDFFATKISKHVAKYLKKKYNGDLKTLSA